MKAGIVIDDWRVPIYQKFLEREGYTWEEKGRMTAETMILHVETDDLAKLEKVLRAAEKECRKFKNTKGGRKH